MGQSDFGVCGYVLIDILKYCYEIMSVNVVIISVM